MKAISTRPTQQIHRQGQTHQSQLTAVLERLNRALSSRRGVHSTQRFLARASHKVAPGLLGKVLIRKWRGREIAALITEVEAYRGVDDPASHAARGRTARNEVMFGRSGMSYVYFVYGMHHCLNVVTEPQGRAGAVLIRGVMLIDGKKVHGPGRVCSTLRLTRAHSGREMLRPGENLELVDVGIRVPKDAIAQTPRIGISKGGDLPWRWEWILT